MGSSDQLFPHPILHSKKSFLLEKINVFRLQYVYYRIRVKLREYIFYFSTETL